MPLTERDKSFVAEFYFDEVLPNPQKKALFDASQLYKTVFQPCILGVPPSDAAVKGALEALPAKEKDFFLLKKTIQAFKTLHPGVDEAEDGHVKYRGFKFRQNSGDLLARAKAAVKNVQKVATLAYTQLEKCKGPNGKGDFTGFSSDERVNFTKRMYRVYLDDRVDAHRYEKVKSVLLRLKKAINEEAFEVICDGDPSLPEGVCGIKPNDFAQVWKEDKCNRFYIGPLFFTGMSSQIGGTCGFDPMGPEAKYVDRRKGVSDAEHASTCTIFHELTHIVAIGNTTDHQPQPYDEAKCRDRANTAADIACDNAENYGFFAKALLLKERFGVDITDGRKKKL